MLARLLRLADYEVAAFAAGEEFLASLAGGAPACVILDVHMPGLSGFDVQACLLAIGHRIPAIFITASDDPTLEKLVAEAKGVALLRKPFSNDQLLGSICTALQIKPDDAS
jgi:FixJ family two-component response regulator